jgi:hypothetical protein
LLSVNRRKSIAKDKNFLELGPSMRASGNLKGPNPSRFGTTGGIGMELRQRGVAVAPTLRFTHWANDGAMNPMVTRAKQVELVFGVRF